MFNHHVLVRKKTSPTSKNQQLQLILFFPSVPHQSWFQAVGLHSGSSLFSKHNHSTSLSQSIIVFEALTVELRSAELMEASAHETASSLLLLLLLPLETQRLRWRPPLIYVSAEVSALDSSVCTFITAGVHIPPPPPPPLLILHTPGLIFFLLIFLCFLPVSLISCSPGVASTFPISRLQFSAPDS